MCFALTYYVCTEGSEGMSPTHVEMSRVEPLEEADVIKTLRLEEEEKAGKVITVRERIQKDEKKALREKEKQNAYLIVFSLEQTLTFLLEGGLPLNLKHTT